MFVCKSGLKSHPVSSCRKNLGSGRALPCRLGMCAGLRGKGGERRLQQGVSPELAHFSVGLTFPRLPQLAEKVLIDQEEGGEKDLRGVAGKKRK